MEIHEKGGMKSNPIYPIEIHGNPITNSRLNNLPKDYNFLKQIIKNLQ
jgi:hypothetical protein